MSYIRGNGPLEVEVSRLQSWVESTDPVLWGRNGEDGMIREHQGDRVERQATERFYKRIAGVCALFGSFPAIIKVLEMLHVIPK